MPYFDSSGVIHRVILICHGMELKAAGRTAARHQALMKSPPKTARRVREGKWGRRRPLEEVSRR